MNPERAIKILQLNLDKAGKKMPQEVKEAVQLGIEALNVVLDLRYKIPPQFVDRLPSESI